MIALVTGGAGFIGSAIARELIKDNWDVRVFDNLLTGFEENVPDESDFVQGDLRDLASIREACRDVDVVFHQAALRSVPKSVDDPTLANACNVTGTLHLLVAAEEAGVRRVVYASSSSVYGDSKEPINREDMVTNPMSPYAASKLAGEHYCRIWARIKGLSTVSLRYFNVFGPGQHPESKYAAVFPAFVSALVEGKAPELHWDGEQSRDFSYIDDVVGANLLAARAGEKVDGAVINIGGGSPRTVNDVLHSVSVALDRWIEPTSTPRRAGDVRRTHADITRAGVLLGWKPEADWQEAVRETARWFQESRS